MEITIKRSASNDSCTMGELYLDGVFQCYTLEDVVRQYRIAGETAIPSGCYRVVITYSQHFKMDLPLLLDVPGFEGVRMHIGNTAADTRGCILLGSSQGVSSIGASRDAFSSFFKLLKQVPGSESIILTIK